MSCFFILNKCATDDLFACSPYSATQFDNKYKNSKLMIGRSKDGQYFREFCLSDTRNNL